MVGKLAWLGLRERAQNQLGSRFDIVIFTRQLCFGMHASGGARPCDVRHIESAEENPRTLSACGACGRGPDAHKKLRGEKPYGGISDPIFAAYRGSDIGAYRALTAHLLVPSAHVDCRHGWLFRCLRRADHCVCSAGADPALAHRAGPDRSVNLDRLCRTINRCAGIELDGRALWSTQRSALEHRHLRPSQFRLRFCVELQLTVLAALRPGTGSRRGGADRCHLHERIHSSRAPRPIGFTVPSYLRFRRDDHRARCSLGCASSRMAVDVHHRRAAGIVGAVASPAHPEVTAVAGGALDALRKPTGRVAR